MKQVRRRSAKEWQRLVDEWDRSGQTAERFAAKKGLNRKQLEWWRWRLRREAPSVPAADRAVKLVPVQEVLLFPAMKPEDNKPKEMDMLHEKIVNGH